MRASGHLPLPSAPSSDEPDATGHGCCGGALALVGEGSSTSVQESAGGLAGWRTLVTERELGFDAARARLRDRRRSPPSPTWARRSSSGQAAAGAGSPASSTAAAGQLAPRRAQDFVPRSRRHRRARSAGDTEGAVRAPQRRPVAAAPTSSPPARTTMARSWRVSPAVPLNRSEGRGRLRAGKPAAGSSP